MTKKIVFGAALALVIVGLVAPSASAACNPPRSASSFNTFTQAYSYFVPTIANPTIVVGNIWSGITNHTGTCPGTDSNWFYFVGNNVGFSQSLGDACVSGCPAGDLSLQVTVQNALGESQTLTSKVAYNPSGQVQYDYSPFGNHNMGSIRPRVNTSSRVATNVNVSLALDAVPAYEGSGSDITGFNILSAGGTSDPGPLASAYTLRSTVPSPGGAAATTPLVVDCTNINQDQWVAVQLVTTAGGSLDVSGRTRIKCNPALANPKYNVVPKKGMGTGTQN